MECSVYNTELERIAIIDSFVSLVWQENYNTLGDFQLEVWQIEDNVSLFQPDYYVGKKNSETLMIIKSVQILDGVILVAGYSATRVLQDRVSTEVISNQNAETALRQLVGKMKPWDRIELGEVANIPDKFTAQKSDATLFEYCENISQAVDMGFRFSHDKKQRKLIFECYKPLENTEVKFSTYFGNINQLNYSLSTANYKNVAIVAGAGEGENRVTVMAGDTESTGIDRREMYVDARNKQPQENESPEDYKQRLVRVGESKLIEQIKIQNIQFLIDDERVNLGDIVSCNIPEFGIKLKVRIIGISEVSQNNTTTRQVILGEPINISRRG